MKFKIDENLPIETAEMLRQAGHDALTVYDQNMSGRADAQIASVCQSEGRVIVSLDLDFADIRAYPPKDFAGLIVLRLKRQDKIHVLGIFERILKALSSEQLEKRLWMLTKIGFGFENRSLWVNSGRDWNARNTSMTIDQVISLAASIGACLSALAAFLTIRQIAKQREASYRPELVIVSTKFECISNPVTEGKITDLWLNETDNKDQRNGFNFFSVPLRNVGLGAAKSVIVSWSFPIEEIVAAVNKLAQKALT